MLEQTALSIRPVALPAIINEAWVEGGLNTVIKAKQRKDYASADYIKRTLSEFISVSEHTDGLIRWSWKPLTPESRYWDA